MIYGRKIITIGLQDKCKCVTITLQIENEGLEKK